MKTTIRLLAATLALAILPGCFVVDGIDLVRRSDLEPEVQKAYMAQMRTMRLSSMVMRCSVNVYHKFKEYDFTIKYEYVDAFGSRIINTTTQCNRDRALLKVVAYHKEEAQHSYAVVHSSELFDLAFVGRQLDYVEADIKRRAINL